MKQVAKLLLLDPSGKVLMLRRNEHPVFGNDPDRPGGTWETGENLSQTMVREVQEETGIHIDANMTQ